MEGLTPGRMVHYTPADGEISLNAHRAAVVTYVYPPDDEPHIDGHVDLTVFLRRCDGYETGDMFIFKARVEPGEPGEKGKWHWIERA